MERVKAEGNNISGRVSPASEAPFSELKQQALSAEQLNDNQDPSEDRY